MHVRVPTDLREPASLFDRRRCIPSIDLQDLDTSVTGQRGISFIRAGIDGKMQRAGTHFSGCNDHDLTTGAGARTR